MILPGRLHTDKGARRCRQWLARNDGPGARCCARRGCQWYGGRVDADARLIAADASGEKSSSKQQTFLFLDWFHVKKGELQVVLDPARISADGQKKLAMYDRDFKKRFLRGSHGFRQTDVPSGVRIMPEVAERSKPWLVADQPWETKVSSPSVIHDEGRFRCWYSAA